MSTATLLPFPTPTRSAAASAGSAGPVATAATPVSARPAPTLRLTRRGRVVVLLLALGLVLGVSLLRPGGSVATSQPGTPEPTQVVVVRSGQTLWDIAATRAASGDVRGMVEHIERLNALDSALVQAGERLLVPVG